MVQFVYGSEPYLIREHITMMKNGSYLDESIVTFDAFDADTVLELTSPSIFGRKLVIVELSEFNVKNGCLERYLNDPCDLNDLVIAVFASKINRNLKSYKLLPAESIFEKKKLSYSELAQFVFRQLEHNGAAMKKEAWFLFSSRMNYTNDPEVNLFDVVTECEKLSCYVGEGGVITEKEVDMMVAKRVTENAFILSNLLLDRNVVPLMEQVTVLETSPGFNAVKTLSLLLRSFRLISKSYLYPDVSLYGIRVPNDMTSERCRDSISIILESIRAVKAGVLGQKMALSATVARLLAV